MPDQPLSPVAFDRYRRNSLSLSFSASGVPENTTLVPTWELTIYKPGCPEEVYATVTGQADYVAPSTGVKGHGLVTFTLSPAQCSGTLWGIGEWIVDAIDGAGVRDGRAYGSITITPRPKPPAEEA